MPPQKQEFFTQTDDSSQEPAGCVMQLKGKGGHAGGVHHDQCQCCLLAWALQSQGQSCPLGAGTGAGAGAACPGLESAAPGRDSGADPGLGLGLCPQIRANSCACWKFLCTEEDTLPVPELPSLVRRAIAPDWCWGLLLKPIWFHVCFGIFLM